MTPAMDQADIFALAGIALFIRALYALAVERHLLRKVLAINVLGSGCFLVFVAIARRAAAGEAGRAARGIRRPRRAGRG